MAEAKKRKIPQRMCVACNEMKPKNTLIRVVRSKDGVITLDLTGKAAGRGAYVCKNAECFDMLKKRRRLNHAFGCEVDAAVYDSLQSRIAEICGDESNESSEGKAQ